MWSALLRTLVMYGAILVGVRIMGKRQISQLQTSELVVTLLISELAVMPIQQRNEPLWNGLLPMVVLVTCEIIVSFFMLKSGKFRQVVCGKPILVVENGKILQDQMRRLRISTEELYEQLRQNGVFSLEEVAYAIIETNGMMSVTRRPQDDPLTPKQAGVKVDKELLEVVVVSDGELSASSLKLCGKDPAWVRAKLKDAGLELSQVFLMTARRDEKFLIVKKEQKKTRAAGPGKKPRP